MKALKKVSDYLNKALLVSIAQMVGPTPAPPEAPGDVIDIKPKGEFAGLEQFTIPNIVETGLTVILVIAALVSLVFLIIGGIRWITSGGDKEGTAKAQSTITAALIGLLIVFGAWAIMRLIETFFGIEIFTLTIPAIPKE